MDNDRHFFRAALARAGALIRELVYDMHGTRISAGMHRALCNNEFMTELAALVDSAQVQARRRT